MLAGPVRSILDDLCATIAPKNATRAMISFRLALEQGIAIVLSFQNAIVLMCAKKMTRDAIQRGRVKCRKTALTFKKIIIHSIE